jgi:hypothetical protein
MPRYFFHTENGQSALDQEGVVLADNDAARIEAVRVMGETLKDCATDFWAAQCLKLTVTDASGMILFVLDLSAVEAPALSSGAPRLPG